MAAVAGFGSGASSAARRRVSYEAGVLDDPAGLMTPTNPPAAITLADGTVIEGESFGAPVAAAGEVVFNTSMVGYPEALTDPSYRGQILVLTFPLIGNYGVPDMSEVDEWGLPKHFESSKIQVAGLVVCEYTDKPSHWRSVRSLGDWLKAEGIPAVCGVDTRSLTKRLRAHGTMLGKIEGEGQSVELVDPNTRNLVAEVSTKEPRTFNKGGSPRIIAFDCGIKYNIIRCFLALGVELTVVPFDFDLESGEVEYDGIFVSNGPGDPVMASATIATLRKRLIAAGLDVFPEEDDVLLGESAEGAAGGEGAAASALTRRPSARSVPASRRRTGPAAANKAAPPSPVRSSSFAPVKPIFGICMGNQLLALAAGARTYKMTYGNRGANQPCIDMRNTRCYITPQNHGFAVDTDSLPEGWRTLFMNANDHSNEGITHESLPFSSVQFHPEACGGPTDTRFLFKDFVETVAGKPPAITTVDTSLYMSRYKTYSKVLLLGSGGLSIGQAGEFDYSGSQALKALKEDGISTVLINPNIATVQTTEGMADKVYFLPVNAATVEEVIRKEKPDGLIISMGGQTALNVGVELFDAGTLDRLGVKVLGTPIPVIKDTEDREAFAVRMAEIGEHVAKSFAATTLEGAFEAADKIGYPVLVRAAFALGGLGSGFANDKEELRDLATKALALSPQILLDQDLRGWKEVEYEVVRDAADNCVTVCNMENFDPLGVHTGDSIVIAPSQTLSNDEYFMLRETALRVVRHLGIVGECNIQYALDPRSERFCIIEVNARLSRSSALASKATGYPLAYVATKLILGADLVTLRNSVTKTTTACFEPALDYVVVKVPRWDLRKFSKVSNKIGSQMKSVGEVMAIGRTFEEAIQKAVRMVNPALHGFEPSTEVLNALWEDEEAEAVADAAATALAVAAGAAAAPSSGSRATAATPERRRASPPAASGAAMAAMSPAEARLERVKRLRGASTERIVTAEEVDRRLRTPSDTRLLDIAVAFERGYTVDQVHALTKIDAWFLDKLHRISQLGRTLEGLAAVAQLGQRPMRVLKRAGFSDVQIATRVGVPEMAVRRRRKALGVEPAVKQIDTLAAEFPAQTNYLYMTYAGDTDDVAPSREGVMVLGCGPYCIGSSVEFDWCAVSCVRTLRSVGRTAIVVNYNPETVSTDYDESDRLYFEELSLERVLDIYERETAHGVIVSVGGQIPNNLAVPLYQQGVTVLGTAPTDIDRAEDRHKFSKLLDKLGVDQPTWGELSDASQVPEFAERVGFPVIVRPSYVLSGAAMRVASNMEQLLKCLQDAADVSPEHPVVVSKFIQNAKEIEFDAVARRGKILNYAISEHVENAGVHSGDATLVLPAQKLYVETIRKVKRISSRIAAALNITGPFNMQFMSKDNDVKVIECNLRASRTFPFVSKTFRTNFIGLATRAMIGLPVQPAQISLVDLDYVGVKAAQFSFTRLQGADPTLGVEMMSTGEVACFGQGVHEAYLRALEATRFRMPVPGEAVLVSVGSDGKKKLAESCAQLVDLGYRVLATEGTHAYLVEQGVDASLVHRPSTGGEPSAVGELQAGRIGLVINEPNDKDRTGVSDGYLVRRAAVDFGVSLITNIKCAVLLCAALHKRASTTRGLGAAAAAAAEPKSMDEYYIQDFSGAKD
ncbi:hypothetical protein FNF29_07766 [Cafeteria roenbergensis]|uniref:Carbamoyl-phosphate synthase (glutamine-hydrolyzing) n=1 Tax=Cafeteria roenbergensis TaxID=33653 RepID=A0A5A8C297_CAFRO|nr:hypothetical protein FNF29_07766 [Cafeteria roenbergensis]|eukprot:KAA0146885.1 hypothetical protein FNF29_07766 [Cafeteria roenbergensis]